jgi:hypothetical protein
MSKPVDPDNNLISSISDRTIIRFYIERFDRNINFNSPDDYFWTWRNRFERGIEYAIAQMDSTSRETLKKVLFEIN